MNLQEVYTAVNSGIIAVNDFTIDNGVVVKLDVYTDKYNIIYESSYSSLNDEEEVALLMVINTDLREREYQDAGANTSETRKLAQHIVANSFISKLGQAISQIREEKNLSKEEVRTLTKFKKIDKIENNELISRDILNRIARALNLTEKDIANKAKSL